MTDLARNAGPDPEVAPVLMQQRGAVAIVTLNRPAARNAISAGIAAGLDAFVAGIEADPACRVAILTGTGDRAFCAGGDLVEIGAGRWPELSTVRGGFAGFVDHPRAKPWIAALNGTAVGGGLELALACDMIVAHEGAMLGLPEVARGVIATAGGVYRLPKRIPRNIALEMIATGEAITAARGAALGLVNRLVPAGGDVLAEAVALAERIAGNAPLAVQESLRVARAAAEHPEAAIASLKEAARHRVMNSADAREGPAAFKERRQPIWTGR